MDDSLIQMFVVRGIICDNAGLHSTLFLPQWIHISRWHNFIPLPLIGQMCTLIELVRAVDSATEPLDQLYFVHNSESESVFLAFKSSDLEPHPLELFIHSMAHQLAKKAAEEAAMFARLGGLSHGRQRGHVSFTCDGWYRYMGPEHDYDSDELPDLV
ncbi:hypothetical protein DFH08DRAFT_939060 [Mycena albidolilacea]|uniref:Uncharacterized protein n=1 Tax=Mycena albidolilacea TaxID=1033008 RepID=A0AAD6ZTB0_9AGAR|nr:hypothetical protein DFH08DRAFT_939060 [Mycena albidolilacea]